MILDQRIWKIGNLFHNTYVGIWIVYTLMIVCVKEQKLLQILKYFEYSFNS